MCAAHISAMSRSLRKTPLKPIEIWRLFLLGLGIVLIIAAPVVGLLPGPGGIIVLALGLALALKNSLWAKRRYIHLKRRWPSLGRWADRGLLRHRR